VSEPFTGDTRGREIMKSHLTSSRVDHWQNSDYNTHLMKNDIIYHMSRLTVVKIEIGVVSRSQNTGFQIFCYGNIDIMVFIELSIIITIICPRGRVRLMLQHFGVLCVFCDLYIVLKYNVYCLEIEHK